jgi:DNA-binding CsgD family transcriptional regulator
MRMIAPEIAASLPASPGDTQISDRRVLFHALLTVVEELSRRQPVLVLVEDAHWADDASLECVRYLSHRIENSATLLVVTSRDQPGSRAHHALVAELERSRAVPVMRLHPLTLRDVTGMMQAMFGLARPAGPMFTRQIFELTGGSPLFIEEALAALLASGSIYRDPAGTWQRLGLDRIEVPTTIQDAVRQRVASLGGEARDVLAAAAVVGQRIEFDLLAETTGVSEQALVPPLADLRDAHLLTELEPDVFAFRHALTRQIVVSSLLARQRRAWHLSVSRAMQSLNEAQPDRYFEDLADHLVGAERWDLALDFAMRAGARSFELGAAFAAIRHFGNAERAAAALRLPAPLMLYLQRGRAFAIVGEFDLARADFERVADRAPGAGEAVLGCDANLELGLLWSGRDYAVAQGHLERALAIARDHGDPILLARCLNRVGNWHLNQDKPERALAMHREALDVFARHGDRRGEGESHDLMAMASGIGGDLPASVWHGRQALAIFEDLGDRVGIAGTVGLDAANTVYDFQLLVGFGTLGGMQTHFERSVRIASEMDWPAGQSYCLSVLGTVYAAAGDFGQALDVLGDALAIAERIGHDEWLVYALWGLGHTCLELGDRRAAREHLERALNLVRSLHSTLWIRGIAGTLARVLVMDGSLDAAEAIIATELQPETSLTTILSRHLWLSRAELLLARGAPEDALAVIDRLYGTALHLRDEGDIPTLAIAKGKTLLDLGRCAEALSLVERARDTAWQQGGLVLAAHALTLLATLHTAAGDDGTGREVGDDARRLIDRIATSIRDLTARQVYVAAAAANLPGSGDSRQSSAPVHPGGLTGREYEVAQLVQAGLSNRDIADRLFLSERTIESHVSNALRKLGFASRAQIAAWAAGQPEHHT